MKRSRRVPWVVAREGGALLACRRCGQEEKLELPLPVTKWVERSRAFTARHEGCEERGDAPRIWGDAPLLRAIDDAEVAR